MRISRRAAFESNSSAKYRKRRPRASRELELTSSPWFRSRSPTWIKKRVQAFMQHASNVQREPPMLPSHLTFLSLWFSQDQPFVAHVTGSRAANEISFFKRQTPYLYQQLWRFDHDLRSTCHSRDYNGQLNRDAKDLAERP